MVDILGLLVVWLLWRIYCQVKDESMRREHLLLWMDLSLYKFAEPPGLMDYLIKPKGWKERFDEGCRKQDEIMKQHRKKVFVWKILRKVF